MMQSDDVIISVRDVWKSFGPLEVLKGMELDVFRGETLVIMGRSGVGKSVLLRQIMGLDKPDRGTIEIEGQCITTMNEAELTRSISNVGMLFQGSALFDSMTVADNVAFYLREHGDRNTGKAYSEAEIADMVADSLEKVGLAGTEQKLPSNLSGGMRRRAALARVIVYRPDIILYDEPTTGLDPVTGMQINELIAQIQLDLNATSIVVTHDIGSALYIADRVAFHDEGRLVHIAEKQAFLEIDDPRIQAFVNITDHMASKHEKGH